MPCKVIWRLEASGRPFDSFQLSSSYLWALCACRKQRASSCSDFGGRTFWPKLHKFPSQWSLSGWIVKIGIVRFLVWNKKLGMVAYVFAITSGKQRQKNWEVEVSLAYS